MPRRSLVTQNNAAPCLGPRRCLDRASTRPLATARTPSLATATTRIAFLMRTALPRQAPDVHGPHTRVPPTSCAPRPRLDPALARTLSHSQQ
jgi:hypothetical protein